MGKSNGGTNNSRRSPSARSTAVSEVSGGTEMLLKDNRKKVRINVRLETFGLSVGNKRILYQDITKIIPSRNACLQLLTSDGGVEVQAPTRSIRDYYKHQLQIR